MSIVPSQQNQLSLRFQQYTAQIWRALCRPKLTAVLFLIVVVVLLLRFVIPQQVGPDMPAATWIATLPPVIQPWGDLIYFVGFSQILESVWFWLPLALLLLNTLVILANIFSPSWQRASSNEASLEWQHPLAARVEQTGRLPAQPDDYLTTLGVKLVDKKFTVNLAKGERSIDAHRRRWFWLSAVGFYVGVLLLIGAFLLSYISVRTERVTLWPHKVQQSQLFDGVLELYEMNAEAGRAIMIYDPTDEGQPAWALFLQPYLPVVFNRLVIFPTGVEPVLTIEATDSANQLRRLMPVQIDLSPDTRLSLPLAQTDTPLYFLIPSAGLAFQVTPTANGYNVQVRRGDEVDPSENFVVQAGEIFEVDDLNIIFSLDHNISLIVRRDWGIPLYLVSLSVLLITGAWWWFFSPWQLWLIPDVKGRGGQLYAVAEKLGAAEPAHAFLAELLGDKPPDEAELDLEEETQN